ncbi:MAG: bifunctional adenosylcobinamide kinase/adenosylcobinamide-phosphate guanylyltransferase, partial [Pseudomonadota bacterium]
MSEGTRTNKERTLTVVLGGARSGKSSFAEGIVSAQPGTRVYIATAEAFDDEMRTRIAEHRARRSAEWKTVDAPLDLADAIHTHNARDASVLVDCLTLWLTNLMLGDHDLDAKTGELLDRLAARQGPITLVTNEVGQGIVPDNRLGRRFRDAQGRLNQQVAAVADEVYLVVAEHEISQ